MESFKKKIIFILCVFVPRSPFESKTFKILSFNVNAVSKAHRFEENTNWSRKIFGIIKQSGADIKLLSTSCFFKISVEKL